MNFETVKTICAASFVLFLAMLALAASMQRPHNVLFGVAVCLAMILGATLSTCAFAEPGGDVLDINIYKDTAPKIYEWCKYLKFKLADKPFDPSEPPTCIQYHIEEQSCDIYTELDTSDEVLNLARHVCMETAIKYYKNGT